MGAYEVEDTGCWKWLGSTLNGASPYRFVYEYETGYVLPKAQHLHHTCENRMCVNPTHLMSVTQAMHNKIHGKLRRGKVRHTDEQKAEMSRRKKEWWAQKTPEERREITKASRASVALKAANSDACRNGHLWEQHGMVEKSGVRRCQECRRERTLALRAAA
jgi:hypothetical protein